MLNFFIINANSLVLGNNENDNKNVQTNKCLEFIIYNWEITYFNC